MEACPKRPGRIPRFSSSRSPRPDAKSPGADALVQCIEQTLEARAPFPIHFSPMSLRVLLSAALLCAVPIWAHHSFGAEYDAKAPITITGVVTKVEWTNPHIHFYLDV